MKNWDTLEADEDLILNTHYTPGRSGRKISKILVHHNAGNLSIAGCYSVWQTREASAHYQVQADGRIGQLVWDSDTAWHAGNWEANLTSIGIEHADISTNPWRVSDATLDNGAHLVAALCRYYGLGDPSGESTCSLTARSPAPHARPASMARRRTRTWPRRRRGTTR